MTTYGGHSGSPIVYDDKTIGIHIKSGKADPNFKGKVLYNTGRLLTI